LNSVFSSKFIILEIAVKLNYLSGTIIMVNGAILFIPNFLSIYINVFVFACYIINYIYLDVKE